jgi:toxin YoeB
MYKISFSSDAQKVLKKYKRSNKNIIKKCEVIFDELMDHPRTGTGHPEALKGGKNISYSRRITAHDRIIYDVYDDEVTVLVIDIEGHYEDK